MRSNLTTDSTPPPPEQQDDWGIADTADHFEITTRAIRFYEDKGLLTPGRANGHRVFSIQDRERLEKILRAKRIGFSLEDIKQFLDVTDGSVTDTEELLRRKTSFEAVITRLRRKRKDIETIAKDMQELCAIIDNHIENAPKNGVFQFAEAYDAMFRAHLDEDFIPI
jgi:DNA-binding transcriptional MerR regulator